MRKRFSAMPTCVTPQPMSITSSGLVVPSAYMKGQASPQAVGASSVVRAAKTPVGTPLAPPIQVRRRFAPLGLVWKDPGP
jgi:hypothetical protein